MNRTSLLVTVVVILALGMGVGGAEAQEPVSQGQEMQVTNGSPVMLIENVGQFDSGARFLVYGADSTFWLADNALWITVFAPETSVSRSDQAEPDALQHHDELRRGVNLKLSFEGANPAISLQGFDRLETTVSYFRGNDPAQWRADVPVWGGVRYADLYPGIDLVVGQDKVAPLRSRSSSASLPWHMEARSGANHPIVRLRVEGADAVSLDRDRLRLTTSVGEFVLPLPRADFDYWVEAAMPRRQSSSIFVDHEIFDLAQSDSRLTASPEDDPYDLVYSTFLGGSDLDRGGDVAADGQGNAFVTGWTQSSDFPTMPGAFDFTLGGAMDAFVSKVNTSGTGLIYSAYLGGSGGDTGYAITVDYHGQAYVTGNTGSTDFPTTPGAYDTTSSGSDAFVVKVNSTGTALVYGTYLGGSYGDIGRGIAVTGALSVYVTGYTLSSDFPATTGAFDTSFNGGEVDAFVARLNSEGTNLVYATFLGGNDPVGPDNGQDYGTSVAVDGSGNAYVTGLTRSRNFPTTSGAFDRSCGTDGTCNVTSTGWAWLDAYVVKLSADGTSMVYGTFLGGSHNDLGLDIAVGSAANAYVTGWTLSNEFPTTPGVFDTSYNGSADSFVVRLNSGGTGLIYGTYLGGSPSEYGYSIAIDSAGDAYVMGGTYGSFPITEGAFDPTYNGGGSVGGGDAFVARLSADGSNLLYSTYLGGSENDCNGNLDESNCDIVATPAGGVVFLTGTTRSSDFPSTAGAFATSNSGYDDVFAAKLIMAPPCPNCVVDLSIQPAGATVGIGQPFTLTLRAATGDQPVDGVSIYLDFDPGVLQVQQVVPNPSSLPVVLQNSYDNNQGAIDYAAGAFSSFPAGTLDIAQVRMVAITDTVSTPLVFHTVAPRGTDATFAGSSVFRSLTGAAVTVLPMTVEGHVTMQRPNPAPHPSWSVPASFRLYAPGQATPSFAATVTTDQSGSWFVPVPAPAGSYDACVKNRHTLQNRVPVTLTLGNNVLNLGTLREGDANDDNVVALVDFSILVSTFGKCQGAAGYDDRPDFNEDDCVLITDFSLLSMNFGLAGDVCPAVAHQGAAPAPSAEPASDRAGAERALGTADIAVQPAVSTVQVGDIFTLTVEVASGAQLVDGVSVYLDYDHTLMHVQQIIPAASSLPLVLQNSFDNDTGQIDYAAGTFSNFPSGTFDVAYLQMVAITTTNSTTLAFHALVPRQSDVTYGGVSVLGSLHPASVVIEPALPCYDFSGNGEIDVADITLVAEHWQDIAPSPYNLDDDDLVTLRDIMLVAATFGHICYRPPE